jgi:hypothetical protein
VPDKELQALIINRLDELSVAVRELREKDIPRLVTDVALIKDRSSRSAKVLAVVGTAISALVSILISLYLKGH